MDETPEKPSPTKPTGRRYASVAAMLKGEGFPDDVKGKLAAIENETGVVHCLEKLRWASGHTQEDVAKVLGCTQSAISKLESGRDEDLTLGQIRAYAEVTQQRFGLVFGKPMNHVEAVKAHALAIRRHLTGLAHLARQDEDLEKAIQAFFGEAFFNILDILSRCQTEMPNGGNIEVRVLQTDSVSSAKRKIARQPSAATATATA